MPGKIKNVKTDWRRIRNSRQFHNVLMFLVFVAVATVFWFIVALNDNFSETYKVKFVVTGVPDSVTFINDPPSDIHVTVRDKGTNIIRSGVVKDPQVEVNFRDFAHDGIFRMTAAEINSELKSDLGGAATISAVSIDSLRLHYTDKPGKKVPVVVQSDIEAASGYIIQGQPSSLTRTVLVYSYGDEVDTVRMVRTQRLVRNDLSKTSVFDVKIIPLANVKIVPSTVKVRVPVEPLVHKEIYVPVEIENLPADASLLLFPNKVPVSFYVPMSHFNDDKYMVRVACDFADTGRTTGSRIPLQVQSHSPILVNVELKADSVDYTLIKH